jgi:long-chain acyl-CoA synthetase
VTYAGAKAVFWTENPMTLFQELQMFKPTIFCSMPRIYKRLYDMIKGKFATQQENKRILCEKALEFKLKKYRETGELLHNIYDDQVFYLAKAFLGGRVRMGLSGGAPIDKHVLEFLRVVFCCPIVEGYGQTEVPGGICITAPEDRESGHVGGPTGAVELRLDDVEELGYTWQYQDEVLGHCPAGEICVRGPNVFPGYFKEPQLTADAFDQEGWLHTGDIGVLLPHGGIKIVDRRKNLFKLSQGEYVSPEKVEAAYSACSLVAQCWVTGDSTMDFPVVFVVAEESATKRWAEAKGVQQSFAEIVERTDFQQELLQSLTELGRAKPLTSFEICRKVKVLTTPWTPDNELVTATLKLRRGILKKHYAQEIAQLYAS